jgi:hypothetical protein
VVLQADKAQASGGERQIWLPPVLCSRLFG